MSTAGLLYGSRSISRQRRTSAAMDDLRGAIFLVLKAENPMTVRQAYYQLVSRGAIDKTEAEYKSVIRLLTEMRRSHNIPFAWIADSTRWMRKPRTYDSMEQMLSISQQTYRRSIWNDQDAYVEIWLEKDALAGVLLSETAEWDVPLMVTRGYPSISYLHNAAEAISVQGKPAFIYYFGDWDPSGRDITRATEAGLREFAQGASIEFQRVAVTEYQIATLNLPTRPTKMTDSRSKEFSGESVEVDAIPPATLREIVRSCIEAHVDRNELEATQLIEGAERESLAQYAAGFSRARDSSTVGDRQLWSFDDYTQNLKAITEECRLRYKRRPKR